MGRLVLNVLLSFAQFEREIIGERTRDKIAATRRKGKWAGGHPVLGYDVDPDGQGSWSTPTRPTGSGRSSPCTSKHGGPPAGGRGSGPRGGHGKR